MRGLVLALDALCRSLERFTRWFEGCWCHQHILDDAGRPFAQRFAAWKKASEGCPWRGRRIVEMVAGAMDSNMRFLRNPSSPQLRRHLSQASVAERACLQAFLAPVTERIANEVSEKNKYLAHVPFKFLGGLSHVCRTFTVDRSRRLVA